MESYSSWSTFLKHNTNNYSGEGTNVVELDLNNVEEFNKRVKLEYPNRLHDLVQLLLKPCYNVENNKVSVYGESVEFKSDNSDYLEVVCDPKLTNMKCLLFNNANFQTVNLNNVSKLEELHLVWGKAKLFEASHLREAHDVNFCLQDHLESVNLERLECVDNNVKFTCLKNLSGLRLGLRECKNFYMTGCHRLSNLDLPLEHSRYVVVCDNEKLVNMSLKNVTKLKSVVVEDNIMLQHLNLNKLRWCNKVYICNNPELVSVDMSELEGCNSVFIKNCPKLTSLKTNSLRNVYNNFYVAKCERLTDLNLSKLQNVNTGHVLNSPRDACEKLSFRTKFFIVDGNSKCLYC
jgi:hypothetical protein